MPCISVIVPVYNCAEYLERSIAALLAQSFRDFELLLVDDGSTDNSGQICDHFASLDERIRVIHQPNGGAGSARNTGLAAATAPYLFFPDADDLMEPCMLETLIEAAGKTQADIVVCGFTEGFADTPVSQRKNVCLSEQMLQSKNEIRTFFATWYPDGVAGYLWNKLYLAEPIRQNAVRFRNMRRYQDGVFNVSAFDLAERVCIIEDVLYHYKLNDVQEGYAKFPRNKLELMCDLITAYQSVLNTWDIDKTVAEERIRSFLLRGTVSCIDCLYNPAWGFHAAERKQYLHDIYEHPVIKRELPKRGRYSRYVDFVLNQLAHRRFLLVCQTVYVKIFLKQRCKSLFRLLKKEG